MQGEIPFQIPVFRDIQTDLYIIDLSKVPGGEGRIDKNSFVFAFVRYLSGKHPTSRSGHGNIQVVRHWPSQLLAGIDKLIGITELEEAVFLFLAKKTVCDFMVFCVSVSYKTLCKRGHG